MSSDLLRSIWSGTAAHLWQTTLVLAALFALARAMHRAPPRVLNALWWAALAKLFLPLPLLGFIGERLLSPAVARASLLGIEVRAAAPWLHATAAVLDPTRPALNGLGAAEIGVSQAALVLTAAWLAGAVAFVVLWLRTTPRLPAAAELSAHRSTRELSERLEAAARGTDVPVSAVRVVAASVVPCVVGILRPRIVLPERAVRELDPLQLRGILLHEDAHRRRLEPLRNLIGRTAVVLFFYYPLLWPVLRRLRETGEMTCDDAALAGGIGPREYAGALARALELGLEPAPSCAALDRRSPSLIRRRLKRLSEPWRCIVMTKHRVMLASAVALVLLASVLPLSSFAVDEQKEEETGEIMVARMVPPKYPEDGLKDGIEGIVYLEVELSDSLKVVDVRVKQGIPDYPSFDESAAEAAKLWVFTVAPEGAEPPSTIVVVPIQFKLDPKKGEVERVKLEADEGEEEVEASEEEARAKAVAKAVARSIARRKIVEPEAEKADTEKDAEKSGEAEPQREKTGETKTGRL